jgi:hypothetical protein
MKIEAAQRLKITSGDKLQKRAPKSLDSQLKFFEDELEHKQAIYMDLDDADADREIAELEKAIKKIKKAIQTEEKRK